MKKVSVIIACRNEEKFIGGCIKSFLDQDYPKELIEIIVVDGMSTDKTWAVANTYREMYPNVDLEVNLKKHKYAGLNQAIRENVTGDFVAIADAHSIYPKEYVSKLVSLLELITNYPVNNIGGGRVLKPRSLGCFSRAIMSVLTTPFSLFK